MRGEIKHGWRSKKQAGHFKRSGERAPYLGYRHAETGEVVAVTMIGSSATDHGTQWDDIEYVGPIVAGDPTKVSV